MNSNLESKPTLRQTILSVLQKHGESFINIDEDELDQKVLDKCASDLIQAIFHERDIEDTHRPSVGGFRIRDLMSVLAVYYETNVPIEFRSSECGGNWPDKRQKMGVFTDHQIGLHTQGMAGTPSCLSISLLEFDKGSK